MRQQAQETPLTFRLNFCVRVSLAMAAGLPGAEQQTQTLTQPAYERGGAACCAPASRVHPITKAICWHII